VQEIEGAYVEFLRQLPQGKTEEWAKMSEARDGISSVKEGMPRNDCE
jgi:hypothetical protein